MVTAIERKLSLHSCPPNVVYKFSAIFTSITSWHTCNPLQYRNQYLKRHRSPSVITPSLTDPWDNGIYSKTCLKRPLKRTTKNGFRDRSSLNAGQKYCRMLQRERSAMLLTCIKLPVAIKTFVLSIFEWPLKTGFYIAYV